MSLGSNYLMKQISKNKEKQTEHRGDEHLPWSANFYTIAQLMIIRETDILIVYEYFTSTTIKYRFFRHFYL